MLIFEGENEFVNYQKAITTMNAKEVLETVCEIVSDHLDMPLKDVKKSIDVPFLEYQDTNEESICDDLDYIELLMAFEEEFGFEISEEDEDNLTTINDVVNYIMDNEDKDNDDDGDDDILDPEFVKKAHEYVYNMWVENYGKEEADRMVASGMLDKIYG